MVFEKARMTVTTTDGRKLTENVTKVKGDPIDNPMSREEIIAKYWVNVDFTQKISKKKAQALLDNLLNLEKDAAYTAFFFNPITGDRHPVGAVQPDEEGKWMPPAPSAGQDMLLVLETSA